MDLKCRICAEPVDADELHSEVDRRFADDPRLTEYQRRMDARLFGEGEHESQGAYRPLYTAVREDWARRGCEALGYSHSAREAHPVIGALTDILGDDVDGLASELEDAEWLGVI